MFQIHKRSNTYRNSSTRIVCQICKQQQQPQQQYPSKRTSKAILIKDPNTGKAVNMNDEKVRD
ncbi:unnamed protein product [Oikopleura dioica]|uniref:Uncharacterized protein n=1 Tax=Oikopleura dioica TaxID=34765 RepID=E4WWJ2_OIKDI|nr:unnamed protein product [Oikopleura dioica]